MSDPGAGGNGWRPLSAPSQTPASGAGTAQASLNRRLNVDGSPIVTSFVRLARTHAFHAAGDAVYAVALVGSIFALDTDAARGRILLYLLLTLAPFALVGPFIGPALDRMQGGRRLMILATLGMRGLLMLLLVRNIETFWLFPIAFTQLVMGKTYSVAKAATVPTTVNTEDELVDKNARLAVLGTVAGAVGAAPALGLQAIWGSSVTLIYAVLIYACGVAMATKLPRVVVDDPEEPDDEVDLRSAGVRLAASAMSVLRAIAGFVFWLMVFAFGNNDIDLDGAGRAAGVAVRFALGFSIEGDNSQPAWKLGFVLAAIGLGIFLGNVGAPRIRERVSEEYMIIGALGAILAAALAAIWAGGLSGAVLLALIVGAAPASAKLAFDSLVQRDAPGANHGAAFGRFETRFQVASVIGSVIAVAPTVIIPVRVGAVIVAIAALVAGVLYLLGSRTIRVGPGGAPPVEPDADGSVDASAGWVAPPTVEVAAVPAGTVGEPASNAATVPTQGSAVYTTPPSPNPTPPSPNATPPSPNPSPSPGPPPRPPGRSSNPTPVAPGGSAPAPFDQAEPPVRSAADPYGQAFADRPVDPPDWAEAMFPAEAPEPYDPLLPPRWLDRGDPDADGEPTPPLGTPRVEP